MLSGQYVHARSCDLFLKSEYSVLKIAPGIVGRKRHGGGEDGTVATALCHPGPGQGALQLYKQLQRPALPQLQASLAILRTAFDDTLWEA